MPFCFVPDNSFKKCWEKPYIFSNSIEFTNTNVPLNTNMNYCHHNDKMKESVHKACEAECVIKQIATPIPSKYQCDKLTTNDIYRFIHECNSEYCKQECSPSDRRCINQCPIDCQRVKVCSKNYNLPEKCRINICPDSVYVNPLPVALKPGTEYASNMNQFCYHYDTKSKKWIYKTK